MIEFFSHKEKNQKKKIQRTEKQSTENTTNRKFDLPIINDF